MNLVNELQISAEQDDVLTVLRKTRRLASKLDRQDIVDWLKAEQEGYPDEQQVPAYRILSSTLAYNTNGYLPAGYGMLKNGVEDLPSIGVDFKVAFRQPISSILSLIEGLNGPTKGLYLPIEEGTDFSRNVRQLFQFNPEFAHQITLMQRVNPSEFRAIPERIKDKVLDWSCKLESAGVFGEDMSFSKEEKEKSGPVIFNLDRCKVEQLNNMGTNWKG